MDSYVMKLILPLLIGAYPMTLNAKARKKQMEC